MVARMVEAPLVPAAMRRRGRPGRADLLGLADKIRRKRSDRDLLPSQPLDVAQQRPLVIGAISDRDPRRPGARGAPDAVDILLGDVGKLEVDHVADAR